MRARSEIHPDMAPLLDAKVPDGGPMTVEDKRRDWTRYTRLVSSAPHPASMRVEDRAIPTPTGDVMTRIYWPAGLPSSAPVFVYLHGGGFILGDLDSSDQFAWGAAEKANVIVVSVDYRLAPEHPFPAAFDDSYGTVRWLAEHGAEIGADPDRIFVGGESAGGSLALAICIAARDGDGPKIAGQVLIYPSTGEEPTLPSYKENEFGPSLSTATVIYNHSLYWKGNEYKEHEYAAPAKATYRARAAARCRSGSGSA